MSRSHFTHIIPPPTCRSSRRKRAGPEALSLPTAVFLQSHFFTHPLSPPPTHPPTHPQLKEKEGGHSVFLAPEQQQWLTIQKMLATTKLKLK
jgi:hypothetical protein